MAFSLLLLHTAGPILLAGAAQAGIGELLDRCATPDLRARSEAVTALLTSFRRWSDADLAALEAAGSCDDPDLAAIARDALERIRIYRSIPDGVWKRFPTVGERRRGSPDEVAELLDDLTAAWQAGHVPSADAMTLAVDLLRDGRETSRSGDGYRGDSSRQPVASIARDLAFTIVPGLYLRRDSVEAWWERHRGRPEPDWFLPDLDSTDHEWLRAAAIRRLLRIGEPGTVDRALRSLETVADPYCFEEALQGLRSPVPERCRPALRSYYGDRRFRARFAAAKLMWPHERGRAADALQEAIEHPERLDDQGLLVSGFQEMAGWMLRMNEERLASALAARLRCGSFGVKVDLLHAFAGWGAPAALDVLAGAMRDSETRAEYFEQSQLINPRICDLAGHLLAKRLEAETPRCWSSAFEDRNENLAFVWARYQASRGLTPSPFHPAGRGPVPRERVDDLMPALLSDVPAERMTAIAELSRLGDGCWVHLQARLATCVGAERERLAAAVADYSNTVRWVEGQASAYLLEGLHEMVNRPFTVEQFAGVLQTWRSKESIETVRVRLERRARGGGLSIAIDAPRSCELDPPFERFFYRSGDVHGMATLDAESVAHVTAALLKDLVGDFAADRPRLLEIEFDKWRPPYPRR